MLSKPPTFAHPVEAEVARLLDEAGVRWEYETREFVLARDAEGRVTEAFVPDFWLPDVGIYLECTAMRQKLVSRKNRKIRKAEELYGIVVTVLYRRDLERLREHGLRLDAAA